MSESVDSNGVEWSSSSARETSWPAAAAFVGALFRPRATAQRIGGASATTAFLVHFCSALLTTVVVLFLVAWAEVPTPASPGSVIRKLEEFPDELIQEFSRDPITTTLVMIGVVAFVEASYLLGALLVAPWGAHDEPMRSSFKHSIRLTWLHSAAAPIAVLLCGVTLVGLERVGRQNWTRQISMVPTSWPTSPVGPVGNSPEALKEYQAAMASYRQEFRAVIRRNNAIWRAYWDEQPWYVRHSEFIAVGSVLAFGAWVLWSWMRMVGARPPPPPIERPPRCERCGYDLTGATLEGRCSECGLAVRDSLGAHVRAGTLWQRRREVVPATSWFACAWQGFRQPILVGRQLRTQRPGTDHREFLLRFVPILACIGAVGTPICAFAADSMVLERHATEVFAGFVPLFTVFGCALVFALPVGTAFIAAVWLRIRTGRNLLGASMQVAAYAAGHVVLCALLAVALIAPVVDNEGKFRDLQRTLRIDDELLMFLAVAIPLAVFLLYYLVQVIRGTAEARFANR